MWPNQLRFVSRNANDKGHAKTRNVGTNSVELHETHAEVELSLGAFGHAYLVLWKRDDRIG